MDTRRTSGRHCLLIAVVMMSAVGTAWFPAGAADVKENYKKLCSTCHGEDGSGNGPAAKVLNKHPGDFTDCKAMKALDREFLVRIISDGGAAVGRSPQMPGRGQKLSQKEIEELADYVSTGLCKTH